MLANRFPFFLSTLLGCVTCCAEAPVDVDLRAVYDRTDRDFERAVMFRPDDAASELSGFTLAPLLIVENGEPGRTPPEVTFERTDDGWTYRWWDPVSGNAQGVHLTLGNDGFPIVYEVLKDSSGARLLFVDSGLEERVAGEFGAPLRDRRFSVERSVDEAADVIVGGIFEPGSRPLGPFVYLKEETHDVNVVLCRCMTPRVFDIVDSIAYRLSPHDPATERAGLEASAAIESSLRVVP